MENKYLNLTKEELSDHIILFNARRKSIEKIARKIYDHITSEHEVSDEDRESALSAIEDAKELIGALLIEENLMRKILMDKYGTFITT